MPSSASTLTYTPAHPKSAVARRVLRALLATFAVAAAAHVAFRLPFTPVPFTLQPLAVLGVGLALGPLDGALAMMAYLTEGASGLPVFSPTGPGGLLQLLGPTAGYLLCYPLVAFVTGAVTRSLEIRMSAFTAALLGCLAATAILFASGAMWLGHFAHLGFAAAWMAGVLPFLPGEAVKAFAAAGMYRALNRPATRQA